MRDRVECCTAYPFLSDREPFLWWKKKINKQRTQLRIHYLEFQQKLRALLPDVRRTGVCQELMHWIQTHDKSRYGDNNMRMYIQTMTELLMADKARVRSLTEVGKDVFMHVSPAQMYEHITNEKHNLCLAYEAPVKEISQDHGACEDDCNSEPMDIDHEQVDATTSSTGVEQSAVKTVMMIGQTGAGKSTLGNWLLGCHGVKVNVTIQDDVQLQELLPLLDRELFLTDDFPKANLKRGMWLDSIIPDNENKGYHEAAREVLDKLAFPAELTFGTDAFQIGNTADSMTSVSRMSQELPYLGNDADDMKLQILDTPGFGDSRCNDSEHIAKLVEFLTEKVKHIDAVIMVTSVQKFDERRRKH